VHILFKITKLSYKTNTAC